MNFAAYFVTQQIYYLGPLMPLPSYFLLPNSLILILYSPLLLNSIMFPHY